MNGYLLGMDYGTGGAKACITDTELNVIAYAYREYKIIVDKPGYSEHKASDYWDVACQLIAECLTKSRIASSDIKAIAISCALPSMVLLGEDGEPLCNAFNLMDRRAIRTVQTLKEKYGSDVLQGITANRLEDHPLLVNVLWERENNPEIYARIQKVHTASSYIKYKLTGTHNISYQDGPLYGLAYNIRTNEFDKQMLDSLDIDPSILPDVTSSEAIIGYVTKQAALKTMLTEGTPVISGQADACAGWLGGGAINVGDIQMNLGTCGNFGVIHQDKNFMDSMINLAYTVNSENTFVVIPTTTTGGQVMRYMRDNYSQLELTTERLTGISAYDMLNHEAEMIPAGSEGLIVLPYLMGERTPLWDEHARGVVFGLSLNHTKAHLVRAMMEGVAYALYSSFELISAHYEKINYPMVLNEGGAKSALWRRIITDVFDQPTVLLKSRVGAPYGDCVLAGKSIGAFSNYQIAKDKAEYVEPMEPDPQNHEMYMEYYHIFKELYLNIKDDFERLAAIRDKYII